MVCIFILQKEKKKTKQELISFSLLIEKKKTLDIGQNCKSASKLGITCIKVNDTNSALMELQKLVGIILLPEPSSKL